MSKIVTSESVNIGHPDKTCDTIADAFLDAALEQDPFAQMAVECAVAGDLCMIYGEATTTAKLDFEGIAAGVLFDIGYKNKFRFVTQVSKQSPEINRAVVGGDEVTANDQGIVYGYATNETPEFMPLPIVLAHKIMRRYEEWRRTRKAGEFNPDAKAQVSVEYDENNKPTRVHTVLVSVSHAEGITNDEIYKLVMDNVVWAVLAQYKGLYDEKTKFIINPSGAFTIWGSASDSGCVGRKIIVDTYGGVGRHGGGAFSSKNATKIDRSAAYYCRYVAKNIVAAGLCDRVEVSASYAIGLADPIKVNIDCFKTNKVKQSEVVAFVEKNFCFRPASIIRELDLLKPQYKQTACYGHFGREEFSWEKIKPTS